MSTRVLLLLSFLVLGSAAPAPAPLQPSRVQPGDDDDDACSATADLVYQARLRDVQDDYLLALANSANLTDPRERSRREHEAREAREDGQREARAQLEARRDLCELLGGGPYDPEIDPRDFVRDVTHPFFPLVPGTIYTYRSVTQDGTEIDRVEVTHDRREILGVSCIVVHDASRIDGVLAEDTLDYFAQDRRGNVWYFGETTQQFEDGQLVAMDGTFLAGRDDAKPGIIMQAAPRVGATYRQEFALAEAEDAATVLDLHAAASVPFGSFSNCLRTKDFSPLEPDVVENKFYAQGVGDVLEVDPDTGERLELISIQAPH